MKIEYFDLDKKDRPVVLIYGNEPKSVAILRDAVHALAQGEKARIAVHELPGFESVDGCQLFFSAEESDSGLRLIIPPRMFECSIRTTWWDNIEFLLEPFCEATASNGFQYLDYGFNSDIQLIISTDRGW
jgi:hypothetical protein